MTPTNVFLLPIPAGYPNAGRAVAALCKQVKGTFICDLDLTPEGRNRYRLWVRQAEAAA